MTQFIDSKRHFTKVTIKKSVAFYSLNVWHCLFFDRVQVNFNNEGFPWVLSIGDHHFQVMNIDLTFYMAISLVPFTAKRDLISWLVVCSQRAIMYASLFYLIIPDNLMGSINILYSDLFPVSTNLYLLPSFTNQTF